MATRPAILGQGQLSEISKEGNFVLEKGNFQITIHMNTHCYDLIR